MEIELHIEVLFFTKDQVGTAYGDVVNLMIGKAVSKAGLDRKALEVIEYLENLPDYLEVIRARRYLKFAVKRTSGLEFDCIFKRFSKDHIGFDKDYRRYLKNKAWVDFLQNKILELEGI